MVGTPEAEPIGVGDVERRHLGGELDARPPGRGCGCIDLVVDVGDVYDERHVEAAVLEKALQQAEDDERPGVADVDAAVDGWPADVDPDASGLAGLEPANVTRERVVET